MQIKKFSKTDIAQSLGTTIDELNKELPLDLKNSVGWIFGKKQSFTPRKTLLIAEYWGSYKQVKNFLQSCV